jgi:hypothetical protein
MNSPPSFARKGGMKLDFGDKDCSLVSIMSFSRNLSSARRYTTVRFSWR